MDANKSYCFYMYGEFVNLLISIRPIFTTTISCNTKVFPPPPRFIDSNLWDLKQLFYNCAKIGKLKG